MGSGPRRRGAPRGRRGRGLLRAPLRPRSRLILPRAHPRDGGGRIRRELVLRRARRGGAEPAPPVHVLQKVARRSRRRPQVLPRHDPATHRGGHAGRDRTVDQGQPRPARRRADPQGTRARGRLTRRGHFKA